MTELKRNYWYKPKHEHKGIFPFGLEDMKFTGRTREGYLLFEYELRQIVTTLDAKDEWFEED